MSKHRLLLINLFLLTAMLLAPALASAAPPSPLARLEGPAAAALPAPTTPEASQAVLEASVTLNSMTADQKAAVASTLQKYDAELAAIAKSLPAITEAKSLNTNMSLAETRALAATAAKNLPAVRKATDASVAVMAKINQELASVLSAEQYAQFQKGLKPALDKLESATAAAKTLNVDAANAPASYTSNCYYSGYWGVYADYYSYYGYVYSYYAYYYHSGFSYVYSAYYYAYYGYPDAFYGLRFAGITYFWEYVAGQDFESQAYSAYYYNYYAEAYMYNAYVYAYNAYNTYGNYSYLYNAYYYDYYGYLYSYYARYYSYYCYYYS